MVQRFDVGPRMSEMAVHNGVCYLAGQVAEDATQDIRDRYEKLVQAIVDAGACPMEPTTVIDLSGDDPTLIRQGRGDPARLGL